MVAIRTETKQLLQAAISTHDIVKYIVFPGEGWGSVQKSVQTKRGKTSQKQRKNKQTQAKQAKNGQTSQERAKTREKNTCF